MLTVGLARKRCSTLAALIAAPAALLLTPERAEAILTYNIFDSGPDVTLQASGSLIRSGAVTQANIDCGDPGKIQASFAILCTGGNASLSSYRITGPASFSPASAFVFTNNVTGILTTLVGVSGRFAIDPSYVDGTPIVSSAIFSGTNLATLGFTTPGLIASWDLVDASNNPIDRIDLVVGPQSVPGPLPLFGAAAAFGWSRTLRRRLSASSTSHA